jgi:uncharacterized membrane protein YtjA (UPF0391 family)
MKKYTSHFLIVTIITALLGFTGLEYTGDTFIRFICLISGIGLFISCLDAVILSKKMNRIKVKEQRQKLE